MCRVFAFLGYGLPTRLLCFPPRLRLGPLPHRSGFFPGHSMAAQFIRSLIEPSPFQLVGVLGFVAALGMVAMGWVICCAQMLGFPWSRN